MHFRSAACPPQVPTLQWGGVGCLHRAARSVLILSSHVTGAFASRHAPARLAGAASVQRVSVPWEAPVKFRQLKPFIPLTAVHHCLILSGNISQGTGYWTFEPRGTKPLFARRQLLHKQCCEETRQPPFLGTGYFRRNLEARQIDIMADIDDELLALAGGDSDSEGSVRSRSASPAPAKRGSKAKSSRRKPQDDSEEEGEA